MAKKKSASEDKNTELDVEIKQIAEKLKQMRIDKGFSSYETFAWEHGIGRMQYWKMEAGTNFTMKSLLKILRAHEVSLAEFFNDFNEVVTDRGDS